MMERRTQLSIWYFILAFLVVVWLRDVWVASQGIEEITYDQFQEALQEGRIETVEIYGDYLRGTYRGAAEGEGPSAFVTPRVDLELAKDLEQYDVQFTGVVENTLLRDVLSWVLPAVVFIGLWFLILRRLPSSGWAA
jgi:cell division protease FtsH